MFIPPDQRLLVHLAKIFPPLNNAPAKLDCQLGLVFREVLVGGATQIFVPHAATYLVEDDALKTVIFAYRPIRPVTPCH